MGENNYYVNRVAITSSIYDFYFKFATNIPVINEMASVSGEESLQHVGLLMSPRHAKALYEALKEQLKNYDELVRANDQHAPEGE